MTADAEYENDGGIDYDAVERVAKKNGLTLAEVHAGARELWSYEQSHLGPSGQVVRPVTARHYQSAMHVLTAARRVRGHD